MTAIRIPSKGSRISLACGAAVALLAIGSLSPALADSSSRQQKSASPWNLVGAWSVTVTLRDCATGAALGPPHQSLVTFQKGGTIHESNGALGFAPNQRSDGHGSWTRANRRLYRQRMIALVNFETAPQPPSPGFLAGWQVIDHTVTLLDPDNLTSEGTAEFYDTQSRLYRSGCSTAVGRRFE